MHPITESGKIGWASDVLYNNSVLTLDIAPFSVLIVKHIMCFIPKSIICALYSLKHCAKPQLSSKLATFSKLTIAFK